MDERRLLTGQGELMRDQADLKDRVVRFFVSSTFQDMKAERDHLVKFTFPQLRKLCDQRSVVWGEVDLRWGVADKQQRG